MEQLDIDFRSVADQMGTHVICPPGYTIFEKGAAADAMWIVLKGNIAIESDGKPIEVVGPDYAIGILSLIDGLPRSTTAQAQSNAELVRIDEHRFRFLVEEMPYFAWYVMRQLAQRLRATNAAL